MGADCGRGTALGADLPTVGLGDAGMVFRGVPALYFGDAAGAEGKLAFRFATGATFLTVPSKSPRRPLGDEDGADGMDFLRGAVEAGDEGTSRPTVIFLGVLLRFTGFGLAGLTCGVAATPVDAFFFLAALYISEAC